MAGTLFELAPDGTSENAQRSVAAWIAALTVNDGAAKALLDIGEAALPELRAT